MSRRIVGAALLLALLVPACGGAGRTASPTTGPSSAVTDQTGTVWLCHPGQPGDPCATNLKTTVVPAAGARTIEDPTIATQPAVDCFYLYPTVSDEASDNADLTIQPTEVGVTVAQVAPFSQVCRVWVPMYRQRTNRSLLSKGIGGDRRGDLIAYDSVLSAWTDYLHRYNDGRPVIFIGHSQGAAMTIRLLEQKIDPDPALRARMILAIIAGGNVAVPTGQVVGATFKHLPLCSSSTETGCIIAYSSFSGEPSADAEFGRPGQGVSLQSGQTQSHGLQVACVNPADQAGGPAPLSPLFLAQVSPPPLPAIDTPWVAYPNLYRAQCQTGGGASWLQVNTLRSPGDQRPTVSAPYGLAWGYHEDDISLALGDLVHDTAVKVAAYAAAGA